MFFSMAVNIFLFIMVQIYRARNKRQATLIEEFNKLYDNSRGRENKQSSKISVVSGQLRQAIKDLERPV